MTAALKQVGRGLTRAFETLAEGWHELRERSAHALTRFVPRRGDVSHRRGMSAPAWGLVSGDIYETRKSIVVEVELPGVAKEDCEVRIDRGVLYVAGEKRLSRDHLADSYVLMERAYGWFERAIPLPATADTEGARASHANGVLTVEFPKRAGGGRLTIR